MIRRSRVQKPAVGMQLFPFLAVLICAMGALIVVLVLVVKHARVSAETIAEQKVQEQLQGPEPEHSPEATAPGEHSVLAVEDLEWRQQVLAQQRQELTQRLGEQRLELSHLEEHIRRLERQWTQMQTQVSDLQRVARGGGGKQSVAQTDLAQLKSAIEKARQLLEETREQVAKRKPAYAIIPYRGQNGTERRPIYIECRASGIVIQPEGIALTPEDLAGPLGPGNPLDATLRAIREHWVRVEGSARGSEPYPLLIVRPDGAVAYAVARAAMSSWEDEFGYELVGEDMELAFPPSDPALKQTLAVSIQTARERQALLVAAMPRRFERGGAGGRFAVPDTGDDELGGGLFGGSGTSGGTGSGRGRGSGGGVGGGVGTADGGRGGNGQTGVSSLLRDSDTRNPGSLAGGDMRPSGRRNGAAGAGPAVPDGPVAAGFAAPDNPATAGGPGAGTGGSCPPGGGNAPSGDEPGSAVAAGTGGGAPGRGSGLASPGGVLYNPGRGASSNSSGSSGGLLDARSNSAAGSSAGSPRGGQSGSGPLPGTVGRSTGAGGRREMVDEDEDDSGARSGPSRSGFAYPGTTFAKGSGGGPSIKDSDGTGITRPILVDCYPDRLVILPDPGSDTKPLTIPLSGAMRQSLEPIAAALRKRMEGWGIAVVGGYWKPVLKIKVNQDADSRFEELRKLMEQNGIDVQRKEEPRRTARGGISLPS